MKSLILSFVVALVMPVVPSLVTAQSVELPKSADGKVTFEQIAESELSKDALYKNAQTWITRTFGDYKTVVQFEDKEAGRVILKGISKLEQLLYTDFRFAITIDTKAKKYRAVLTDLEIGVDHLDAPVSYHPYEQMWGPGGIIDRHTKEIAELRSKQEGAGKGQIRYLQRKIDEISKKQRFMQEQSEKLDGEIGETVDNLMVTLKAAMKVNNDF
nr:DUF4468 domain-containing protein [uncultured Dyadobacter sp.]